MSMARVTSRQLNIRVPPELVNALEEIAQSEHLDKGAVARRLLIEGIERWRLERALRLYHDGQITKERAAEKAGVSLYELMDLARERGIPAPLDVAEAVEEVKALIRRHT
jgi:predicted HTH domain antitoxin